jgi:hypothetical protein
VQVLTVLVLLRLKSGASSSSASSSSSSSDLTGQVPAVSRWAVAGFSKAIKSDVGLAAWLAKIRAW